MKRVFSIILSLTMLTGMMTVGANATYKGDANHITEDTATNNDSAGEVVSGTEIGSADVSIDLTTTDEASTTNVYAVSYSVTELNFEYGFGGNRIWNPETLQYEYEDSTSSWSANTADIEIYNYSDQAVTVSAQASASSASGVTVSVYEKDDADKDTTEITLASAYMSQGTSSARTTGAFTVELSGAPITNFNDQTIAITLTVNKAD